MTRRLPESMSGKDWLALAANPPRKRGAKKPKPEPPLLPLESRHRWIVGIDPGAHTGVAIYDRQEGRWVAFKTMTFWTCFRHIREHFTISTTLLVIEDPNFSDPTYRKPGDDTEATRKKIAQNIGMNKAHARLLIEGFGKEEGYAVQQVWPNGSKWNALYFRAVTGHPNEVSEHARDAARRVVDLLRRHGVNI